MVEIIPAILEKSLGDIEQKLKILNGASKSIQLDVCDGIFVPNISYQEQKLPKGDFEFEIDLMVEDLSVAKKWILAGAKRIIFHIENPGAAEAIASAAQNGSAKIGAAISLDTPIEILDSVAGKIAFIQTMGIAKIGFQNQPFDSRVFNLIKILRQKYPQLPIQVDGGVSLNNAKALVEAGVTRLIAGSAIFNSPNPQKALENLRKIAG